jgi:hypothetical protein
MLFSRKRRLAAEIQALLDTDPESAIEVFAENRSRLRRRDAARLDAEVRHLEDARENRAFLAKGLADGSIKPAAGFELLQVFREAGHVTDDEAQVLRQSVVAAHRAEMESLLDNSERGATDYYRRLDSYRTAGYLTRGELGELERMVEEHLNPRLAARRLFADAQLAHDPKRQAELLLRYLIEFSDHPEFADAASLYVALQVDRLWKALPRFRSARTARVAVLELNGLLKEYLPYTADIADTVPINRMVDEFMKQAGKFRATPDPTAVITTEHLDRSVEIMTKDGPLDSMYEQERNSYIRVGAVGRVRAVSGDLVLVEFRGKDFGYSQNWRFEAFADTPYQRLPRHTNLSLWHTSELGLISQRKPSPVEVHQYKRAVETMQDLLEAHRIDNRRCDTELLEPAEDTSHDEVMAPDQTTETA